MSESLHVRAGDTLDIPLEGTQGTGFRWQVSLPAGAEKLLAVVDEGREMAAPSAGGVYIQHFRFRALAPGQVDLTFRYRRSWEAANSGTVRVVAVQIEPAA